MKITFLGHSTLLIEVKEHVLLVDPFITGNEKSRGIVNVKALRPDYILLTHAHQDHTLDVERIAEPSGAMIISNYEIATYYEKKGFKVHPMNHGGRWKFPFGMLQYTNAIHSSSFPDGTYGGQPGGFILTSGDQCIYIAGDTALTMDMKLIPMTNSLDLAVLPIGDNFTMGVEDAILAAKFLECKKVLGCHYDTFGYIEIDHQHAHKTFEAAGLNLLLPAIGESVSL